MCSGPRKNNWFKVQVSTRIVSVKSSSPSLSDRVSRETVLWGGKPTNGRLEKKEKEKCRKSFRTFRGQPNVYYHHEIVT
jgi:hypothetical protein